MWNVCMTLCCSLALLFGGSLSYAADKPIVLSFETGMGTQTTRHMQALEPWAKAIEERSGGKVQINFYPNGSLAKVNVALTACSDGLADIVYVTPFFFFQRLKALQTLYVPGLNSFDPKAASLAFWEFLEQTPEFHKEAKGVKILSAHVFTPLVISTVKAPVNKIEDMKGLRLRTNGRSTAASVEAMGASAMTVAGPDIFMNLQKNILDGVVVGWEGQQGFGSTKLSNYYTVADFLPPNFFYLVINQRKWDQLPDDVKKIFEEESGAKFAAMAGTADAASSEEVQKSVLAEGKTIITLDPKERARMDEVCAKVRDEELATLEKQGVPNARKYVDLYTELLKKHSAK